MYVICVTYKLGMSQFSQLQSCEKWRKGNHSMAARVCVTGWVHTLPNTIRYPMKILTYLVEKYECLNNIKVKHKHIRYFTKAQFANHGSQAMRRNCSFCSIVFSGNVN